MITNLNERFRQLFGLPDTITVPLAREEVLALDPAAAEGPGHFVRRIEEVAEQSGEPQRESSSSPTGGRSSARYMPQRVDGGIVGRGWSVRDVTERIRLEVALSHQAFHDSLTDLANKALFTDRLDHALARAERGARGVAVLFIDLDEFKTVNDGLGHTAGDELLDRGGGALPRLRSRHGHRRPVGR